MSTAAVEQAIIDTNQIEAGSWVEKPFPAGHAFRVVIAVEAYEKMWKHARETLVQGDLISEVGGILVGNIFQDTSGPYLEIQAAIIAEHTRSENTEVAFTPETWAQVNRVKDSLYPDQRIIGWYHTHPRFGIFLSERDKFIHRHSFSQPWAAAYVIDPVQNLEGLFLWSNNEPREPAEYWVGEERRVQSRKDDTSVEGINDRDKEHKSGGSRAPYLLSFSLLLATLIAAGGLYYINELRRVREIELIMRGLNSQQQNLDRAEQGVALLQQSLNATGPDEATRKAQVDDSIKQLQQSLLAMEWLTRAMQNQIYTLEKAKSKVAAPETAQAADGESEKKQ